MRTMKFMISLTLILCTTAFWGCGNNESKLLEQTITKTNLPEIIANLKNENVMDSEDIMLFSNAIGRLSNIKVDSLNGKTVQQVIEIQKEFLRENSFKQLAITGTRVAMNMNYEIKYLGLQILKDSVSNAEGNTILYEIKNNYDKAIKKVSGFMQFYNQQNQIIKQFELDNPEQIPANGSLQFYKAFAHDRKEVRDSLVRYHNAELIVRWQPQYLEFTDGTKLEVK